MTNSNILLKQIVAIQNRIVIFTEINFINVKQFFLTLLSVLLWIYLVLTSIFLTPFFLALWLITVIPDKNLWLIHRFSCFWGALYIWSVPIWKLKIYGREKLSDKKVKIMVSNHQSFVDIIVVNSLFRHFRWTSKVENFKLPFVGWVLILNRSIRIYRGAGDAWKKFEQQASKSLSDGNSIMIFPEGTRSKTRQMGKFKEGAFLLALHTKTDIQPMVLDSFSESTRKSGLVLTGSRKMYLKVLEPMPYESFKDQTPARIAETVHNIIETALKELRANYI
jgi:1-acyl-sn-glycerol-3-phosphate acyltransferase